MKLRNVKQVAKQFNLSPWTIYRRVKDGTFPKPIKIGHLIRWKDETLDAWLAQEDEKVNNITADVS